VGRALGAERVTAVDPDPQRRESAVAMGATDALASVGEADIDAYDAAVECVGHQSLLQACQPALRPQGRIVISGACAEPTPVEPLTALLKELSIRFSVCYTPTEFREVIAAFESGAVDPAPMLGPTLGLDRVAEAFDLTRGAQTHGRVLIRPPDACST